MGYRYATSDLRIGDVLELDDGRLVRCVSIVDGHVIRTDLDSEDYPTPVEMVKRAYRRIERPRGDGGRKPHSYASA